MKIRHALRAIALCLVLMTGWAAAQDATPEVLPDTATLTPTPTETATPTETPVPSPTPTIIPSPVEPTAEPTEAATDAPLPSAVPTDVTPEVTTSEAVTVEATALQTAEATATEAVTAEATAAETAEATEAPPETTPETTATASPLKTVQGKVVYQNRQGGGGGIQVEVYNADRTALLSAAQTDEAGNYTVQAPADAPYWLVAAAPRYVTLAALLNPDAPAQSLVLLGGDLDQDGCVGATDLALLTAQFGTKIAASDINGDGVVEAADLAILSGNFDAGCRLIPATPEPTAEATDTPPAESTATLTPEPTSAPTETATAEATTAASPAAEATVASGS
jgi:hypothetical protein